VADLETFRSEVRDWLGANCPASMRTPMPEVETVWGGRRERFANPESRVWLERMAERGWTCPTWPQIPWNNWPAGWPTRRLLTIPSPRP
jgi:hypothetical protein